MQTEKELRYAAKNLLYAYLYGAKMAIKIELKIGDIVRLVSGGPDMTVNCIDDNTITSIWFDGDEYQEIDLPVACLALKVYTY